MMTQCHSNHAVFSGYCAVFRLTLKLDVMKIQKPFPLNVKHESLSKMAITSRIQRLHASDLIIKDGSTVVFLLSKWRLR